MMPAVTSPSDRVPIMPVTAQPTPTLEAPSEAFAKDAVISWFRGEFAAANAIIDALCSHLTQLEGGGGSEYESVFKAIHRRRLNWIPILQMQKYYSVADCALELRRVADMKMREKERKEVEAVDGNEEPEEIPGACEEESTDLDGNGYGEVLDPESIGDDSPKSEITDSGSQGLHVSSEHMSLCSGHGECEARCTEMKMTRGFIAKEHVKGRMVNVVRGLKLYEDLFTESELSTLSDYVSELRVAGRNGELSGETFILYQQQAPGNKRELIQLGEPIFGRIKEEATTEHQKSHLEPIPALLQGIIDRLLQWHLISENRKPNSCIINFFDEGEFSQPFMKPPHLDQPISTLILSESTMAFGRALTSSNDGNYKGPLMLSLKQGSLLVMRGNSCDMARHVMCASPNKRLSITFFRVRLDMNQNNSSRIPPLNRAVTLWRPGAPNPYVLPKGALKRIEAMGPVPKLGLLVNAPGLTLAPVVVSPRVTPPGGTGVFLPWTVGSRKHAKHLPPRAQRRRFLSLSLSLSPSPSPPVYVPA